MTTLTPSWVTILIASISIIVWLVRLEAKVRTNQLLFNQFVEESKEQRREMKSGMDKMIDLQRKTEQVVNQIKGSLDKLKNCD